jgi:hydroxymethylglutaryl-CoA lyase
MLTVQNEKHAMLSKTIQLVECPRDAMQGWKNIIPTGKKIQYLDALLRVGFDTIDFGSFVSASAIPQMADTKEVISSLNVSGSRSKLLAIVANARGAREAVVFEQIHYLGYPFSISETFQLRNTNSSIEESFARVEEINTICSSNGKKLVVYISMAFGNPFGDFYSRELVYEWAFRLASLDIKIISLADTVGLAEPAEVADITAYLVSSITEAQIGVHLHSTPHQWQAKLEAAFQAGCTRFDGALGGVGGCPMAGDILVGNMNTELMIGYFNNLGILPSLDETALEECLALAREIFN